MRLQMVQLSRKKSGLWAARKVIPSDVREAYGKREEKKSWPAALTPSQAKQEYADWLAPIEAQISSLRSSRTVRPIELTKRQCVALAGEWYRNLCSDREAVFTDTSAVWDWEVDREAILPQGMGDEGLRSIPFVTASQKSLLESKQLILSESSSWVLQQEMLRLYLAFLDLMERRVDSDFGEDPVLKTLPEALKLEAHNSPLSQPSTSVRNASAAQESLGGLPVSILSMFEEYAATRQMSAHTVSKWRLAVRSLADYLGHDDARRISRADLQSWFAKLQAEGRLDL